MRLTGSTTLAFGATLSLALLAPLGAWQAGKPPRGARLAVVAYHDSRLLTLCPAFGKDVIQSNLLSSNMRAKVSVNYPPTGEQSIAFNQLDGVFGRISLPLPAKHSIAGAANVVAVPSAASELDRLARDLEVEHRLVDGFRERKTYTVVDDTSEADFVFLAESTYVSMSGGTGAPGGASLSGIIGGDRPRNWRESIVAIAVPGAIYRQHAGDGAALSSGRIWSGLAVAGRRITDGRPSPLTIRAAAPEDLVDRFHGGGRGLPEFLPVCAATAGTLRSIHDTADSIPPPAERAPGMPQEARGATTPPQAGDAALPRFRSGVTLVTVPLTVTGADGAVVGDLPLSSFRLFEEDVEQIVDRLEKGSVATDIALLIDSSAGMREPRDSIRSSAAAFATALRAADRAMVVKFGSRVQVLSELTDDRARLQAALAATGPGGGTRLYDALALVAADRLGQLDGRKAVVVLTDGRDTHSQLTDRAGALAAMEAIDAPVYVIRYETPDASSLVPPGAYGIRRWLVPFADPGAEGQARATADAFLLQLASRTGGQLYAARADAEVPDMIAHIAAALSDQVVLRYYPANDKLDGKYRRIRVAVDCEGCTVRARPGYRAGVRIAPPPGSSTPGGTKYGGR